MYWSTLKRTLAGSILFAILCSSTPGIAQVPGFFLDEWKERTAEIPTAVATEKTGEDPSVQITVNQNQVINKVSPYIYGNNAVTWDNGLRSNATAMKDLNNLSPNVLRWPGGNLSNIYFWNRTVGDKPSDIPSDINPWYGMGTAGWQMGVDEYYDLLEKTNSTGIICVNYSYARYGTGPDPVASAAHLAAEWVRYDNGRTKFWELGNENYGNWQTGYEIDVTQNQDGQPRYISGQLYGQHCRVFIDSMRAAAAEIGVEIKIGPNVYDAETSHNQIFEDWNEGLMPEIGDLVDFLAVHSYFTPYNEDSPVSTILNSHDVPEEIMAALVADMVEAGKPMLPVAMTEWNIFATGSWQQVSYVNGMLAALTLGEFVKHNYGMGNRWDLVNGWNNGNDHAMFSTGGEPGVDIYNPRAAFFYMYYHQKFFGDQMVESTVTGNIGVVAYASTFTSGETGIVVVNKGRTGETVTIDIPDDPFGLNYYYYTLTGGTDNGDFSRKVLINGIETDEEGGGPDEYETIPAKVSETWEGIKVDLPPLSVVYVLVEAPPPLSYIHSLMDTSSRVIDVYLTEEIQAISDYSGLEVRVNDSPVVIESVYVNFDDQKVFHIRLDQDLTRDDQITLNYSGSGIQTPGGTILASFASESVENRIPRGPFEVVFVTREKVSEDPIAGCKVECDEEERISDDQGRVTYLMMEGIYALRLSKTHVDTLLVEEVHILSDTIIYLDLEMTAYRVSFEVSDSTSGDLLRDVEIKIGDLATLTNSDGEAFHEIPAGTHTLSIEKLNYHPQSLLVTIDSDTSFQIALNASHAAVKFRVKSGDQPVNEVQVEFGGYALQTDLLGSCRFEHMALEGTYEYHISKENYYPIAGEIVVTADTTLEIQIEKSVARLIFVITTEWEPLRNGYVILGLDTAEIKDNGQAIFYNLPRYEEYSYSVECDNYVPCTETLRLNRDTTVQIVLSTMVAVDEYGNNRISVYPNPTREMVQIISEGDPVRHLELIDLSGRTISEETFRTPVDRAELYLTGDPGIYFLKIVTENKTVTKRLIKQ